MSAFTFNIDLIILFIVGSVVDGMSGYWPLNTLKVNAGKDSESTVKGYLKDTIS